MALSAYLEHILKDAEELPPARPYINHAVAFKQPVTPRERAEALEKAGLNVFFYPAALINGCDLLSDSGTGAMTNEQWASLHYGDEAYGSNQGYFLLREQVRHTFGDLFFNNLTGSFNAFLFHQDRAAECALFTQIGKLGTGLIIPSNGHFDTTHANIEANGMRALNLFSPALKRKEDSSAFKGDMDTERFIQLLEESRAKVPLVYLTITNNTGGGQPVSLGNIAEVARIAHAQGIPLFLDACRFAENAWFIQQREPGYREKAIPDIVREIFSYADGFTISFKKDGLANMGGGLFLKENGLFVRKYPRMSDALTNHQILTEGNPTYGGLSGRDIMTIVEGLKTVVRQEYLDYRTSQVQAFGEHMKELGLPVLTPAGGHAVYMDMTEFFSDTRMRHEDFGGISCTALLLAAYGHRACELGDFAFGSYDTVAGKDNFPEVNFVRFAVPRLRYEREDLEAVAGAVKALYDRRDEMPPVRVTYGRDLPLRHFKARFEFID
ncbi:MAG: tryptophanase [Patescibacteria group bacterium]